MFVSIPVDIRTSAKHGGFVLLDTFRYEHGDLTVRVYAPGSGDSAEFQFSDVIGFTMKEDVFGADGRPAARKDPGPEDRAGFFQQATEAPAMISVRGAVPDPSLDSVQDHKHYRLSLREHELSFVAAPDYEINVLPAGRAN